MLLISFISNTSAVLFYLFSACHPMLRVTGSLRATHTCGRCEQKRALRGDVQVAAAGEDEEDLRVGDGQQRARAAGRDDEHGCALNSWSCALGLENVEK